METNEHNEQDAETVEEIPIPVVMETEIDTRPLEMKFPVSSGLHHMDEPVETPNEVGVVYDLPNNIYFIL